MINDNEKWILSFYRNSEITGALFFGRLAQYVPNAEIRNDLTKHFADESQHAWHWTKCLEDLGQTPVRVADAYQDRYFEAAGAPVNLMEIMAVTQVFEIRVIKQYNRHMHAPNTHPLVKETFKKIMLDEAWHVKWIGEALKKMEVDFGADLVAKTLDRFQKADELIYGQVMKEYDQRISHLFEETQHECQ